MILKEDRSGIAAVSYYQHNGHYTRIAAGHGPCTPAGTGRCGGSGGFETDGTHPVVNIGRMAHGGYHDTNRWPPRTDRSAPSKDPLQCAYYGDIRDPGSAADNLDFIAQADQSRRRCRGVARQGSRSGRLGTGGLTALATIRPKSHRSTTSIAWPVRAVRPLVRATAATNAECIAGDDRRHPKIA